MIFLIRMHSAYDDYVFYCSASISTLVEDMQSGANTLHNFGALFLWDVRIRQDHGETSLMSL